MSAPQTLHGLAWIAWVAATAVALTLTRNPIYLGLLLLWILAVVWLVRLEHAPVSMPQKPLSIFRFGLFVVLFSALFNGASVHVGRTILFVATPQIPLLGGPITGEAIVYGVLNGLALTGLFAAFSVLNQTLSMRTLIHLIPRAYYPLAVVMSISLTFVPSTLRAIREIGEAQAIRGHSVRGLRGWFPLLLPLLVSGLERALLLAEAMTARGFASEPDIKQSRPIQALTMASLIALVIGLLLHLVWNQTLFGLLVGGGALAALVIATRQAGQRHAYTKYRPEPWRSRDWIVVVAALGTSLIFALPLPGLDRSSLFYDPYPALSAPDFSIALGIATWGVLMPVLVLALARAQEQSRRAI